ncbi:DUF2398 family protein [Streptomyces sp. NPDC001508]|uniref:DUF2398 family protein n=1 Tax=Streptomyces sp. NPDC001508 TaxID=3154656 RepID=UPI0033249BF9
MALRQPTLADVARLTGLPVERGAEGIMLVDTIGHCTGKRFPGRGGATNRTAGLLLAKIADLQEDRTGPETCSTPCLPSQGVHVALLYRIDLALPSLATDVLDLTRPGQAHVAQSTGSPCSREYAAPAVPLTGRSRHWPTARD